MTYLHYICTTFCTMTHLHYISPWHICTSFALLTNYNAPSSVLHGRVTDRFVAHLHNICTTFALHLHYICTGTESLINALAPDLLFVAPWHVCTTFESRMRAADRPYIIVLCFFRRWRCACPHETLKGFNLNVPASGTPLFSPQLKRSCCST